MTQQPSAPAHRDPTNATLNLITWSVRTTDPRVARAQAVWLADQERADVVVLTDVSHGTSGQTLVSELSRRGYCSIVAPLGRRDSNTVLASRHQMTAIDPLVDALAHRTPAAHLHLSGSDVVIAGVSVPTRQSAGQRGQDKQAMQEAIAASVIELAESHPDGPVLVAGSLAAVEPGHRPAHQSYTPADYSFYRSFGDARLVDAFRALRPEGREYSWFDRNGAGHRVDHLFVSARHAHLLTGCGYLQTPRQEGFSERAALFAGLRLPSRQPSSSSTSGADEHFPIGA